MVEYLVFRLHRLGRRLTRRVERTSAKLRQYSELYILGRWHQLRLIRRFIVVWAVVLGIGAIGLAWQIHRLGQSALVLQPVSGGTFIEGEVGSPTVFNPVLPDLASADDVNSLVFDGLTKWGPDRKLESDLATSWEISSDGKTYTFHLRHGVKWTDGVAFNASDVLFTLRAIQDPDSRSPLASSWQDVQASSPDPYTVVYKLPNAYPPFIESTTVGIVPRHILEDVNPQQLGASAFSQHPVGTGPFIFESFDAAAGVVNLKANPHYFGGKPKLAGFEFRFYPSPAQALTAYAQRQVTAVGQITAGISKKAAQEPDLTFYDYALPSETTLFFNLTNATVGDHAVRQALAKATDRDALIAASEPSLAIPATQPILPGQPGYTTLYRQDQYNLAVARLELQNDGWVLGKDGIRTKGGKPLKLTIVTLKGSSLQTMAQALVAQWKTIGVQLTVQATDLNNLEQTYIRPRNYQMLLYGVDIGADPDVYAYWHSSQIADPGLNLSEYQSPTADTALESGRLKTDPLVRAGKYRTFLQTWDADQPAIVVATPIYRYGVAAAANGLSSSPITEPSDRFTDVVNWTVLRRPVRR